MVTFDKFAADLPRRHTQWFTSPVELEEAMKELGICQPTRQSKRGDFRAGLATRKARDCELFADRYSTALSLYLEPPPDGLGILIPRSVEGQFVVNGIKLGNDHLTVAPNGEGMYISGPGPIGSDCITIQEEKFLELLETLCPTATAPEGLTLVKVFEPELRSLGDFIAHLIGVPDSEIQGERLANLLAWIVSSIGHASKQFQPENINGNKARGRVARSAREFIESGFRDALPMEDLCRHTGVGIRTVQRCFREYFDFTVTDFLKTVRLDSANRELMVANGDEISVTEVALRNGFTHLGRFSVAYHMRFGEQPSETLAALSV